MKLIEKLCEMIDEEIGDAEKYIDCALNLKENQRVLSDVFSKLSDEEMRHMQMLHEQVARLIEEYKRAHGDPPADMLAVYEYLHKKHIEKAAFVRNKQAMYKMP